MCANAQYSPGTCGILGAGAGVLLPDWHLRYWPGDANPVTGLFCADTAKTALDRSRDPSRYLLRAAAFCGLAGEGQSASLPVGQSAATEYLSCTRCNERQRTYHGVDSRYKYKSYSGTATTIVMACLIVRIATAMAMVSSIARTAGRTTRAAIRSKRQIEYRCQTLASVSANSQWRNQ